MSDLCNNELVACYVNCDGSITDKTDTHYLCQLSWTPTHRANMTWAKKSACSYPYHHRGRGHRWWKMYRKLGDSFLKIFR